MSVCAFSLTACSDMKKIELQVSVYDTANNKQLEKSISVDLYRHLAKETVDTIIDYVNKGYYDNKPFYLYDGALQNKNQGITFGDYKLDSSFNVVKDDYDFIKTIRGQFEYNGTIGSDLYHTDGAIGIWRNWTVQNGYESTDDTMNSARAELYISKSSVSSLDGYFCVFAKIDLDNTENSETWNLIKNVFSNTTYYSEYVVYYTGDYNEDLPNCGLTFHCIEDDEFIERYDSTNKTVDGLKVFTPEGTQIEQYKQHSIYMPVYDNGNTKTVSAKIVSAKVI